MSYTGHGGGGLHGRHRGMGYYHADPQSGLGFSLRPPKWLRKAQPGKVLKKIAPVAAIGAALLIPGVAPAAFAAVKAVGGAAGKFLKRLPIKQVTGTLAPRMTAPPVLPGASLQQPLVMTTPAPTSIVTTPDTSPVVSSAGGGGGTSSWSDTPESQSVVSAAQGGTPQQAGMSAALPILAGLALLGLAGRAKPQGRARRRKST